MTCSMEGSVILIWGLCCSTFISELWVKTKIGIIQCALDTVQGEMAESVSEKVSFRQTKILMR